MKVGQQPCDRDVSASRGCHPLTVMQCVPHHSWCSGLQIICSRRTTESCACNFHNSQGCAGVRLTQPQPVPNPCMSRAYLVVCERRDHLCKLQPPAPSVPNTRHDSGVSLMLCKVSGCMTGYPLQEKAAGIKHGIGSSSRLGPKARKAQWRHLITQPVCAREVQHGI